MPSFRTHKSHGKDDIGKQLKFNFKPWEARTRLDHKTISLGFFETKEEAIQAEQRFKERHK